MNRLTLLVLSTVLALGTGLHAYASAALTESDYKTYRILTYEQSLRDARKVWARRDPAKLAANDQKLEAAFAAAGWTPERLREAGDAIDEVFSPLHSANRGELTAEDLKQCLAECDATTVSTVKAHFDELNAVNDSEKAEKQAREEHLRERAGVPPTPQQLEGTWVFDVDATVNDMLQGSTPEELEQAKADILSKTGRPAYTFGPGTNATVRSKAADGTERLEKSEYRLDGGTVYFKQEGRSREQSLGVGLRGGKLVLGMGPSIILLSRQ